MRNVKYKKSWAYASRGVKAEGTLVDLVLDALYLMNHGVIPPFHVLNEALKSGGHEGGMGPGTTWKGFEISREEYDELMSALLTLNVEEARKVHPYLYSSQIIVDEELNECADYLTWLKKMSDKYFHNKR